MSKTSTLLVTGIHQEELAFGDRVVSLLSDLEIDVMRIPEGISHSFKNANDQFYYETRHREIYLQLNQQLKKNHRLLIDLHSGIDDQGHCADIYCGDETVLAWLTAQTHKLTATRQLRLVKIQNPSEDNKQKNASDTGLSAHTIIPEKIWHNPNFIYIGLEIYLEEEGEGIEEDWALAICMIKLLQRYVNNQ